MKYTLHIFFCVAFMSAYSQNMHQTGRSTFINIQGGPSKFLGDIGGVPNSFLNKLSLEKNTYFYGASLQRYYDRKFSWELGLNTGTLSASDADVKYTSFSDPEYFRYRRNLDFKTNILEASLHLHFYPLQFLNNRWKLKKIAIQPFFYGGFGYYSFNPQGSIYDATYKTTLWVDLKPLRTEGQGYEEYKDRKEYNLQQVNIPYGFGFTYFAGENLFISISANGRKLFTDYIDDVSTTYIDTRYHSRYFTVEEDLSNAILFSDKSPLVSSFYTSNPGDIRGNNKKVDSFFNYNIKIGFRIAKKKSKKHTYYKFDETEICD
jgi:hypothetical protein